MAEPLPQDEAAEPLRDELVVDELPVADEVQVQNEARTEDEPLIQDERLPVAPASAEAVAVEPAADSHYGSAALAHAPPVSPLGAASSVLAAAEQAGSAGSARLGDWVRIDE